MYAVYNTVDSLGGRCCNDAGWLYGEYASLREAEAQAEELTAIGCCGYVIRIADGAILAPDGMWIEAE